MKFSQKRSLQSKILILFIFLLLVVQLISSFTTYQANQQLESAELNNRLSTAKKVFNTQFTSRRYYLSAMAETAAKDYALKSVFKDDTKSFLLALDNHRKRIDSDIALAIDINGMTIGQLISYEDDNGNKKVKVGSGQGKKFLQANELIQEKSAQLIQLDDSLYQLSLAPLKSGSRIIGWIGFGYVIDSLLADDFAKLTNVDIGFLLQQDNAWHVIANSTVAESINFDNEFAAQILLNNNDHYVSTTLELGKVRNNTLSAVLLKSKADLLKNIQADWRQLVLLTIITLILSILGAVVIANGITKPIKLLISQVKSVAQGNYNETVEISDSKELTQLADEFNHMKQAVVTREKTISHQAFHDSLTNLPNRNSLLKYLDKRYQQNSDFILLQLNIRRLAEVNDTLGHKVGDKVIIEVAKRLQQCPLSKQYFHLGGDDFIILVDVQAIDEIVNTILPALEKRYQYENFSLHLQYSIGIALSSQHNSNDVAELLQKSNVALQFAKKQKQTYQIYDPQFDSNTLERLFLTNSLKTAIEENHLVLFYQPKLSLKTMKLSHVEALVRWQHPEKGLIPPDSFISIAEKTGQMDALTRWVTTEAMNQFILWRQANLNIKIAINISAENLLDKSYSDFVIALKNKHDIPDQAITLEVTEDAVVADPTTATEILTYLRDHGFKLSIDDYGTGYSSLAQLKQLPVQELKIDRSFVQHLMENSNDQIIVRSTIKLAHNMGLTVVAEGIEDKETLLWLQKEQCELAQGFYISRPVPAKELGLWLEDNPYGIEDNELGQ